MRKIIAIGESVLDTVFVDDKPVRTFVGGRIANAAASAGITGLPVTMVSECCNDHVGDLIADFMESHNVATGSIDRYTDGNTAISMIFNNGDKCHRCNYIDYPETRFDVVWPRIDEDDIVLFGSFYAIDPAARERMYDLLRYASQRKAVMVYLPGCQHGINCRITKVMPAILENFELADIVIATKGDMEQIFPDEAAEMSFESRISFYCPNMLYLDDTGITAHNRTSGKNRFPCELPTGDMLGWQAGFTCGVVYSLLLHDIKTKALVATSNESMASIVKVATEFATEAANESNCISEEFGKAKQSALEKADEARATEQ